MPVPKREQPIDLRSLARSHAKMCVDQLRGIAINGRNEGARVAAISILLDRGFGKAEQPHTGNVDADIRITIRQIISGDDAKVIEHGMADERDATKSGKSE